MELPEDIVPGELIQGHDKAKQKVDSNHNIRIFTEDEIKIITSNYNTLIGKGGFGEVYRGILDDDCDLVAVKRYIRKDLREEFMEEVSIHSQMNHKNVVKIIGYCIGEGTLTMVTEYISNGNLDHILHCSDISIPLDIRLGIAIGCAEALSYMHSMHLSSDSLVCHADIKPANILLDDNLKAKVSDFGASRILSGGITRYTLTIKGSIDYMDPIYFHEGRLTPRSDVYSFGIILLELIARKRVKQGDFNLIGRFSRACAKGKWLRELFDEAITNDNNLKILKEIGKLAIECLNLDIHSRPRMNDVAKRLRTLRKVLKGRHERNSESILATHYSWHKNYKQDINMPNFNSIVHLKKRLGFFKRNTSSSRILSELGNVRIFTEDELIEVTQNYSYLLCGGTSAKVYKGTLEDNTVVAVRKFFEVLEDFREAFINGALILSQIVHKNIIKLLGCCLDADTPIFVYEYAAKGSLPDVLDGQNDFPLDLRVKIAVKTAEALEYLHSSATGIVRHGYVVPSKILLDDNFMPKLSGFSWARRLVKENKVTARETVISSCLPGSMLFTDLNRCPSNDPISSPPPVSGLCNDPIHDQSVLLKVKTDVYQFGVLLLVLISRKNFICYEDHHQLIFQFIAAYEADNSGKTFFDEDITDDEDIALLEEIGRLALKCISAEVDERPTMKEVAEQLWMIRRFRKKHTAEGCALASETEAVDISRAECTKPDAPLVSEIVESP